MGWNYLFIPKLRQHNRWSLRVDMLFHLTLYSACGYFSMLEINLVSKRVPWWKAAISMGSCTVACYCFYPRPVLVFGYRRCLRVCVCVCVRVSVNHEFVRAITHQPFKLGSQNLDQRCQRPWLSALLFCGMIDRDLQGQIELQSQIYPILSLCMP